MFLEKSTKIINFDRQIFLSQFNFKRKLFDTFTYQTYFKISFDKLSNSIWIFQVSYKHINDIWHVNEIT